MRVILLIAGVLAASQVVAGPLDELLPRPRSVVAQKGVVARDARIDAKRGSVPGAPVRTADESYRLTIAPDGITILAPAEKGERAARATLDQLAKLSDGRIPCCRNASNARSRFTAEIVPS